MENMGIAKPNSEFWKGKRVLITGHTGFKGAWLTAYLHKLGACVSGYALVPNTNPSLFEICNLRNSIDNYFGDIRDYLKLVDALENIKPEIIIHMAAQPLVRRSYEDPVYTLETNVIGTANLFKAIKNIPGIKVVVNVTTDKCYENNELNKAFAEEDKLGGKDMYSASKACSEIITHAFRKSFFDDGHIKIATARAGNVIGGGDWSSDRLIPDILKAINSNKNVRIRYPESVRPWQHVLEPLTGYLLLAEQLYFSDDNTFCDAWNFGPRNKEQLTVLEIAQLLLFNAKDTKSKIEICKEKIFPESGVLKLNSNKAREKLKWNSVFNMEKTISSIVDFNMAFLQNDNILDVINKQIDEYINLFDEF